MFSRCLSMIQKLIDDRRGKDIKNVHRPESDYKNVEAETVITPRIPFTIEAGTYTSITLFLETDSSVSWFVGAEKPLAVYVIDQEQYDNFKNGNDWTFIEGHCSRRLHEYETDADFEDNLILLINNTSDNNIPVVYDIQAYPGF